jgi:hypothetical protein
LEKKCVKSLSQRRRFLFFRHSCPLKQILLVRETLEVICFRKEIYFLFEENIRWRILGELFSITEVRPESPVLSKPG